MIIPLYIQEIVYTKLKASYKPNMYTIRGTAGANNDIGRSALSALKKLTMWAERQDSTVEVIKDDFATYPDSLKKSNLRIVVRITDPVSSELSILIEKLRGKLNSSPKDRSEWIEYRKSNIT